MTTDAIEGGCLCGAIRYRVAGPPRARTLCHCRSCRFAAGGPSVAWAVFGVDGFAFTAGTPRQFHSSPGVVRTFCDRCGTALTYQVDDAPDTIDVTTVTLDAADDFPPTVEIWVAHKLAWETLDAALPHFPGSSRPNATEYG
jgi:hypothetical protein